MKILNLIDHKLQASQSGNWLDNVNPANGAVFAQIADSDKADVDLAYEAAAKAFPGWSATAPEKRAEILMQIAERIASRLDEFALAETTDNGKPLSLSKSVDIPRAVENFNFFAHAITQFASESHEDIGKQSINFTLRKPIGVVGCISPWNLPLYLFTWKIAPALAAGNCVVAKPSEITPLTAFMLAEIIADSNLPAGVLNIVNGLGPKVGQAIVAHPHIKAISFTGGTATGAQIARTAAPLFKKLSLELGGKNPNLIFADCDYEKMLAVTVKSSFRNQGQICLCGSRILVEQSIYEQFKKDFVAQVARLKVGDPLAETTDLGAVVSEAHMQKILSFIDEAKNNTSEYRILHGGNRVYPKEHSNGFYIEPTVIEVTSNACRLNQEEIFGPVVTLMSFKTEDEAIAIANDVQYGLSASLWTENLGRSMRVAQLIETGILWVNTWLNRDLRTPFGGMKASGVGREGGLEALRFFTEAKNVCIKY
ncbi:MAG: aldehyde dehydrogenase [Flavobacteriaceae bacterium]|nr:aldehyde dehydrogenase [Flavobacteriaceae bacterium]